MNLRGPNVPIVVISSSKRNAAVFTFIEASADDCLTRPLDRERLRAVMREAVERNKPLPRLQKQLPSLLLPLIRMYAKETKWSTVKFTPEAIDALVHSAMTECLSEGLSKLEKVMARVLLSVPSGEITPEHLRLVIDTSDQRGYTHKLIQAMCNTTWTESEQEVKESRQRRVC